MLDCLVGARPRAAAAARVMVETVATGRVVGRGGEQRATGRLGVVAADAKVLRRVERDEDNVGRRQADAVLLREEDAGPHNAVRIGRRVDGGDPGAPRVCPVVPAEDGRRQVEGVRKVPHMPSCRGVEVRMAANPAQEPEVGAAKEALRRDALVRARHVIPRCKADLIHELLDPVRPALVHRQCGSTEVHRRDGEEVERCVGLVWRWPELCRETARWIVQKVVGARVDGAVVGRVRNELGVPPLERLAEHAPEA
mmetsp:Transcript_25995/g.86631  ORF Transcript_25995/g.86631 Transcript_25995/m.86631 type:complete len:254 (+) Transcript_25995:601-1362(+)